jgi:hypothetical protein
VRSSSFTLEKLVTRRVGVCEVSTDFGCVGSLIELDDHLELHERRAFHLLGHPSLPRVYETSADIATTSKRST